MTLAPRYKLCPECRTEYVQLASRCSDCDADLVDALPEEEEAHELPPASELECLRVAPLAWIRALSEALQEGSVPHRVEPADAEAAPEGQRPGVFGDVRLFGLYVRSEHAGRAREVDAVLASQILPPEAPPVAAGEEEPCPACGAPLAAEAAECGDCGLAFG